MLIKLLPTQIEPYWDVIKFSAIQADAVKDEDISNYCIDLLLGLLNSQIECIVSVDDARRIQRILLISFYVDTITGKKHLRLRNVFAFISGNDQLWQEETQKVYDYAKRRGCEVVYLTTANPIIYKLADRYGMKEHSKNYAISI